MNKWLKTEPNGSGCEVVGWMSPEAEWNRLLNSYPKSEQMNIMRYIFAHEQLYSYILIRVFSE